MKGDLKWELGLGMAFVALSVIVYFLHYLFFRDIHHIFLYLVGDIAFVFLEVFLITIVVHRLLALRERRGRAMKLNMVIGVFFSEVGTELLRRFLAIDKNSAKICVEFSVVKEWNERDFSSKGCAVNAQEVAVGENADFPGLREFLLRKREFMVSLLANPALLEHETFTNLLWAVFHLAEELEQRKEPAALSGKDREHLAGDVKRAYGLLLGQWLEYMAHLKHNYPYLFSLSSRMNPFDRSASAEVK